MMNRRTTLAWPVLTLMIATAGFGALTGCGGDETDAVAMAPNLPPPPPPPTAPRITPVDQLMTQLGIDERVVMTEAKAPDNDPDRKAVLEFFDAFARGDSPSVSGMLSFIDQAELKELVDSGAWLQAVNGISEILVETGTVNGTKCALGLFTVGNAYQAQLWYFRGDAGAYTFEAAPAPPGIVNRLSGDWIESWHKIIEEAIALSMMPDVELDPSAMDDEPEETGRRNQRGSDAPRPDGGGGPGALRDPPSAPVSPPGG